MNLLPVLNYGYNKKGSKYSFSVDLYSTTWVTEPEDKLTNKTILGMMYLQVLLKFTKVLKSLQNTILSNNQEFVSYVSIGDWRYSDTAKGKTFDADGNLVSGADPVELDLDGEFVLWCAIYRRNIL